ncbi:MAG: DUF3341 domain-containing protein [Candidatus Zixiibacteriota bacterium]
MGLIKKIPAVILAEFESADSLYHAAEDVRNAGYKEFDCHSPFPIHGMDEAMGVKRSPLGYIIFSIGSLGLIGALVLMWWTSAVDYPLVISGKPFFSFPAFIPITFALTVLTSAITATIGMIVINQLPRFVHPVFSSERFGKFSDDGFFVSIESIDKKYDEHKTAEFLKSIGGKHIEVLKE